MANKRHKVSFKAQKKLFSKTAANQQMRAINVLPPPMRGGRRM